MKLPKPVEGPPTPKVNTDIVATVDDVRRYIDKEVTLFVTTKLIRITLQGVLREYEAPTDPKRTNDKPERWLAIDRGPALRYMHFHWEDFEINIYEGDSGNAQIYCREKV